jgi:hypothetical protein
MTILEDIINMAKANGYRVLTPPEPKPDFPRYNKKYVFLITPSGNVLSINEEYFGGCNIALKYVPSRECGTGCAAYDPYECPTIWTMSMIEQKEKELVAWARRMKAKFYNSPDDFIKHYEEFYNVKLEEVT